MENCTKQKCFNNDLQIAVKATRRPRFKAGADLSKTASKIEIDIDQFEKEETETIGFTLRIFSEGCEPEVKK